MEAETLQVIMPTLYLINQRSCARRMWQSSSP